MSNTIKEVLENFGLYYHDPFELGEDAFKRIGDKEVDFIIAEITRLLEEAKPKYPMFTRDMVSRGEVKQQIEQYHQNIQSILGSK